MKKLLLSILSILTITAYGQLVPTTTNVSAPQPPSITGKTGNIFSNSIKNTNGAGYAAFAASVGNSFGAGYTSLFGTDPNKNAYIYNSRGLLIPRLTTVQRDAVTSPQTGLIIYNTTTNAINWYSGGVWNAVGGGGITVGTTTITSGADTRAAFNNAGVYGESADFTFNDATNVLQIGATNVSTNSLNIGGAKALQVSQLTAGNGGSITIGNTTTSVTAGGAIIIGNFASASNNGAVAIGGDGGPSGGTTGASAGEAGVAIGGNFYGAASCGFRAVTVGTRSSSSGVGNTILGHFNTGGAFTETILLGSGLTATASNQVIIGGGYSSLAGGIYFGDVTSASPKNVVINSGGGSEANGALMTLLGGAGGGTNKNAGGLVLGSGISTGTGTGSVFISTPTPGSSGTGTNGLNTRLTIDHLSIAAALPIKLSGYTVATLPAGSIGMTAYVTDATAPTYLGALIGGGAVATPVFFNGSAWVSY